MGAGEDMMCRAEEQVCKNLASNSHAIKTAVKAMAREQVKNLPRRLVTSLGVLVPLPVVGSVLNAAVDSAITKIKQRYVVYKQAKYARRLGADSPEIEDIRRAAKADMKEAKDLLERLDGNLTKLNASVGEVNKAMMAYKAKTTGNPTAEEVWEVGWNVACQLHYVTHYEEKCQVMIEVLRLRLDMADTYVGACRDARARAAAALVEDMDDAIGTPHGPLKVHFAEEPPAEQQQRLRIHLAPD